MSDNVVPFPQQGRSSRRPEPSSGAASLQASELDRAVQRLMSAAHGTLRDDDRQRLALNIGRLVEERSDLAGLPRSKLLARAWQMALPPPELPLSKRMRLVRYDEAELGAREVFAAVGAKYVKLTQALASSAPLAGVGSQANRADALIRLLEGTSFDPDPTRAARSDLRGAASLQRTLNRVLEQVLERNHRLPEYFQTVSDQRLRMRALRPDEEAAREERAAQLHTEVAARSPSDLFAAFAGPRLKAETLSWAEWEDWVDALFLSDPDALDIYAFDPKEFEAEAGPLDDPDRGDFVPEAIHDGLWLTSALSGVASTWPRITLGVFSLSLPATIVMAQAEPAEEASPESESPMRVNPWAAGGIEDVVDYWVAERWLLRLTVVPMGGCDRDHLRLALIALRLTEDVTSSELEARHRTTGDGRPIQHVELPRFAADDLYRALAGSQQAVWSVSSRGAEPWLATRCVPPAAATGAMKVGGRVAEFEPFFAVPAGYGENSGRTPAGLIERNLLYAPASETILARLSAEVASRQEALDVHLAHARSHHAAATQDRLAERPQEQE